MKYTLLEKLDKTAIMYIAEGVREAEFCRDIDSAIRYFKPIWADIDIEPDFSELELENQATLYHLAGQFLSYCGKARSLKNYQERGKDLICKAIDLFTLLDDKYNVADSQTALAMCYFWEGATLEAEIILEHTAQEFAGNNLHLVYLKNRINLILTKFAQKKYQEAIEIIEQIQVPMEFCEDKRASFVFHEKVGLIYRGTQQYEKAILHYNQAIRLAYETNNLIFVSSIKNNLAFLYNKLNNFDLAHFNINQAIEIASKNNISGWLPPYLDTKALIYANEGNYDLALETIESAISMFQKGDDYRDLTDAIWNKCKFLLHLDRKEEAILLFSELIPTATQRVGEFVVKQFTKEFSDLVYVKHNGSLDDELRRFKRVEVVNAIRQADFKLFDAAQTLKIDLKSLVKILDKEFPEMYDELDIQRLKLNDEFENISSNPAFSAPRKISQLNLQNIEFCFTSESPEKFSTFYISQEKLPENIGINHDIIAAIAPIEKAAENDFVIVLDKAKNVYSFGQVQYEKSLDLLFILDKEDGFPIFLNDFEIIGKAAGYCNFNEIDNDTLHFNSFNF